MTNEDNIRILRGISSKVLEDSEDEALDLEAQVHNLQHYVSVISHILAAEGS